MRIEHTTGDFTISMQTSEDEHGPLSETVARRPQTSAEITAVLAQAARDVALVTRRARHETLRAVVGGFYR